ncbi:hypothetical protein Tco_0696969 [Tanacetum coccineum]
MHGNHEALTSRVSKKIGNGENTSFWDDKWLDDEAFKSLFTRLYALETCKSIRVAVKLGQPSLAHSFRRPPRGVIEEEQLNLLGSRITDISLPNMSDHWLWSLEAFGSFSVRSARIYIDENILSKVDVPTRWVKIISIKVNIHAWKWNLHPIFSSLVPWLDKFGAKFRVGRRWMLPLLVAMKIGLFGLATFDFLSN